MWATAATANGCFPAESWVCWGDLVNNLVAGALLSMPVLGAGPWLLRAIRAKWAAWRSQRAALPRSGLSADDRDRLIAAGRARSWGRLASLISVPEGYIALRVEPQGQDASAGGARSAPADGWPVLSADGIDRLFEICGPRVLLTGPPGSGKTVSAYKIAELLAHRYQANPGMEPLPVVLNLSTWQPGTSIRQWVVDQLCELPIGPGLEDRAAAAQLVDTPGELALILDGLTRFPRPTRKNVLERWTSTSAPRIGPRPPRSSPGRHR